MDPWVVPFGHVNNTTNTSVQVFVKTPSFSSLEYIPSIEIHGS